MKGTPHGVIETQEHDNNTTQKMEVWAQDIQGIMYYIDKSFNVYQVEDIMQSKVNPKVIAKYVKVGETYMILNRDK
jgi:metal-dependent HD superfamily phosphatase/phosphodiesterase